MMNVQRVNVQALQKAVEALIGPQGAAVLERVYQAFDHFEAELRTEVDQESYEAGYKDGFKDGYDAHAEVMYGEQPTEPGSVICLPDETNEHDTALAIAVNGLESDKVN